MRKLNLFDSGILPEGVRALGRLSRLELLYLSGNLDKAQVAAIHRLRTALRNLAVEVVQEAGGRTTAMRVPSLASGPPTPRRKRSRGRTAPVQAVQLSESVDVGARL